MNGSGTEIKTDAEICKLKPASNPALPDLECVDPIVELSGVDQ